MKSTYKPRGTCSNLIETEVEEGVIKSVKFTNGCPGNLLAISELVKGMSAKEAIERLEGIRCGNKMTSCADQLAKALKAAL
jgi:uncharacterized protein (TIGR03905 family)